MDMETPRGLNLAEQFAAWTKSEILYGTLACGLALGLSVLSDWTLFTLLFPLLTMSAYLFYAKGKALGFIPAAFASAFQLWPFLKVLPYPMVFTLLLIVIIGHLVGILIWNALWQSPFHRTRLVKLYPPLQLRFFLLLAGCAVLAMGLNWRFGTHPLIPRGLNALFSVFAFFLLSIGLIEHWLVRSIGSLINLQALYLHAFTPGGADSAAGQAGLSPALVSVLVSLFYLLQFVIFYCYNRARLYQRVWDIGQEKKAAYTCMIQSDYPDHKELAFWNPYRHLQNLKRVVHKPSVHRESVHRPSENVPLTIPWERCNFYFCYGFSKADTLLHLMGSLLRMGVIGGNSPEAFWYFGIYQGKQELVNLYPRQQFLPGKTEKTLLIDCINLKEPIRVRYLRDRTLRLRELKEKDGGSAQRLLDSGYLDEFFRLLPNHFLEETLSAATALPQGAAFPQISVSYLRESPDASRLPFSKPNNFREAEERLSYLVFCYGMDERYLVDIKLLCSFGVWPECAEILDTYYLNQRRC